MTDPEYPPYQRYAPGDAGRPAGPPPSARWTVDGGRLWAGGAATAVVAALVAIVGLLVAQVFGVEALKPFAGGELADKPGLRYALVAAAAALVATGLMHVLILTTPKPQSFFTWIVILATAVAALLPFLRDATQESQVATALIYVAIGICIGSLVSSVAARSIRPVR
jgi:hypothetical protein